jgi:hypothetical protein
VVLVAVGGGSGFQPALMFAAELFTLPASSRSPIYFFTQTKEESEPLGVGGQLASNAQK